MIVLNERVRQRVASPSRRSPQVSNMDGGLGNGAPALQQPPKERMHEVHDGDKLITDPHEALEYTTDRWMQRWGRYSDMMKELAAQLAEVRRLALCQHHTPDESNWRSILWERLGRRRPCRWLLGRCSGDSGMVKTFFLRN